ncbi:hypothetical protein ACFQZC_24780 [Streptacidiphilus monticola]
MAEGLGLTGDQLSDRLVPDLGLESDGTTVVDYGTRRFTVGFDEQLRPSSGTRTASGARTCRRPASRTTWSWPRPSASASPG